MKGILSTFLLIWIVMPSAASVTRSNPLTGVATSNFGGVGQVINSNGRTCSGVAIFDGSHVLTTRHCVTQTGEIDGDIRSAGSFRFVTDDQSFQAVEVYADFGSDLALICLDARVPDAYFLWGSDNGDETGRIFTAVGYGETDSDGDSRWGPGGRGVKRVFENTVDRIGAGGIAGQGEVLGYDFDLISAGHVGSLEGLHGPGDSGAGAFLIDPVGNGGWLLAGVASSAGDPLDGARGSLIRVATYREQILTLIPEPATATLLGFSVLFVSRRSRRDGTITANHR